MARTAKQRKFRKRERFGWHADKLKARHVAEVGVGKPGMCQCHRFIKQGIRTLLVEPHPVFYKQIERRWGMLKHVSVANVAITEKRGTLLLVDALSSSYIKGTNSPVIQKKAKLQSPYGVRQYRVDTMPFSDIDDGTIDAINIDTEGCEYYVLATMTSRPKLISLEMEGGAKGKKVGRLYNNPRTEDILAWLGAEGYARIDTDPDGDWLYARHDKAD